MALSATARMLRSYRHRRGVSQLELAALADVSPRHLSCLECGRAKPGRQVLLRIGQALELPPGDCQQLLNSAGFLSRAEPDPMTSVLSALGSQPSYIIDGSGSILQCNSAFESILGLVAPAEALWRRTCGDGPRNLLVLSSHPEGLRPYLENAEVVLAAMEQAAAGAPRPIERYRFGPHRLAFRMLVTHFSDDPAGPRVESAVPADIETTELLQAALV